MDAEYLQRFLTNASRGAKRNEIRELLKLLARPEIISLAGGLPSPETFPIQELSDLVPSVLADHGAVALQYGTTEGDPGLRLELIRLLLEAEGERFSHLTLDHILITSASQQGLDLCARIFLSPGDVVVCGLPSYLGALGAFTAAGARLSGIPLDDEGLRTDLLEQRLVGLRRKGVRPKLVYVVPDFQNPAGVTLGLERRHELLSIAREFDLLVVEDSPYRQLRYVGESQPSLAGLDRDGRVISLFTFSKILFPGMRLGWAVAHPEVVARLTVAKQPVDLCTNGLSQLVAREYLKAGCLPAQVERIRAIYSVKRKAMLEALDERIDPAWGVRWTRPEGGLFLWVTLPPWMDAAKLLEKALEEKMAFVLGRAFHCDGSGGNTLRLNFSYPTVEQIEIAAERLARCIATMVSEGPGAAAAADSSSAELVSGEHALEQLSWSLALSEVVE
jgi:2-aminoadipate transaminase